MSEIKIENKQNKKIKQKKRFSEDQVSDKKYKRIKIKK